MLKKILLASLFGLLITSLNAQDYGCATDEHLEMLLGESPEARAAYFEQLAEFDAIAANGNTSRDDDPDYIIPVVVHVLYSSCEGNISKSQIEDGIRILDEDFRRTNPDTNLTRSFYEDVAVDVNIEFRLAKLDPTGQPTDGINRIQTSNAVGANNSVKSLSYWPSSMYMNIWIVESIQNFTGGNGIILGYAQFPGSGSWNTYGLVVRNDAFGTIGTSNADGRTVTHEIGHCLNLFHTFQGGCGTGCSFSGDRVCDTPPATSDPTYTCNFSINTCSNDAGNGSAYSTNVPDQIENYMSYNSCQNMFTQGQSTRMITALNVYDRLENLVSEDNLIATGVKGLVKADFSTPTTIICNNNTVTFSDNSYFTAEAESWAFSGNAQPSESTEQNPEVWFPHPGLHDVTYTATENGVSSTSTRPVFVVSEEGQFAPYFDDLESTEEVPNDNWYSINIDEDAYEWKLTNEAAFSGEKSIKMDNYGRCGETSDELVSQSFDFSPYSSVNIDVAQAYARGVEGNNVFLRLYASNDCGENWSLVWARSASALQSVTGIVSEPFIPADESEWIEHDIDISQSSFMREGVLLKWEFGGLGGNNLYLDDFRVTGVFSGDQLLRSPENGKKGMAKDVLIDWKSAGFVDGYDFEIDTSIDFDTEDKITGSTTAINTERDNEDTEFLAEDLDLSTKYYWRVRYDQNGVKSDWSEVWTFEVDETGLGLKETLAAEISVFPNPSNGVIQIQSTVPMSIIDILDYTGRTVKRVSVNGEVNVSLDTELRNGVYFMQITDTEGNQLVKTLIIQ